VLLARPIVDGPVWGVDGETLFTLAPSCIAVVVLVPGLPLVHLW
jgi:hypothetical protein